MTSSVDSAAAATSTGSDDIQIIEDDGIGFQRADSDTSDSGSSRRRNPAWWALPLVPWLWYVVRSLFAFMDVVAAGLPVIIIVSLIGSLAVAILRRSLPFVALAASLALFFVVAVLFPFRGTGGDAPVDSIRVGTFNAGLYWFSDNDLGFLAFQEEPDLLVGVELAESHDTELRSRFSNAITDVIPVERMQQNEAGLQPEGTSFRRNGLPSIGVYSDLEMVQLDDPLEGVIDGGLPGFRLRVTTDSGDMILYALHIPRPAGNEGLFEVSAGEHVAIANAVADAIEAETLPTMVLGDLNAVDRGQAYRSLTRTLVDGIRHADAAEPTTDRAFPESLLFARVDHLLMSPGLCTENAVSIDTLWSDHHPILADIGPCQ